MIKVTIYNEFYHEQTDQNVSEIYPKGIDRFINGEPFCIPDPDKTLISH